jgi:hypothetical protein
LTVVKALVILVFIYHTLGELDMTSSQGYETTIGDNGETLYLVGEEWVTEAEAAEYAQDEADALRHLGDPGAYDGYPEAIAPQRP